MTIVITLYEEIRPGDAARVLAELAADPSADVVVRINSPGGSATEGLAIFNALRGRAPVVHIDGVAASIASLIAMAGAKIIMSENALVMVHDPWCQAQGNSTELRRTADLLDKHRDAMLSGYARTGLAKADLLTLLAAETWLSADEAVELGFADEIAEPLRYAAHAPGCFAGYQNTPKELLLMNTQVRRDVRGAGTQDPNKQDPGPDLGTADVTKTMEAFKKGLASDAVTKAAHDAVLDAFRDRNAELVALAEPHMHVNNVQQLLVQSLADPETTVQAFGQRVLAELARGAGPLNGGAMVRAGGSFAAPRGAGGGDFVQAATDALALRAGIRIAKPHPGARDVQSMGLEDIMRVCASRNGRDLGTGSRLALVKAALSTSDFPAILENTLGKALRVGFETEPSTFEAWTRKVLVPDFKPQTRVILGSAPELLPVAEGGEYKLGTMEEDKSLPYSVGKFGRLVRFTWEALVNDDIDAFLRTTQALGQAAARAEADAIYAMFMENGGAGPAMQDGAHLFHANHFNLAATSAGIDAGALGAARVLLRRQKAVGGGALNLTPRWLLVAPEHEQAAETLLAAAGRGVTQGADNALTPAWLSKLELVVEARLAEDAFYVLAGPDSVDTLERAWLADADGPVITEEDGFGIDATTYKIRHVFGARWLDWRGAVKVPLAG